MRNTHATRSGTGRHPQRTSDERRKSPNKTHLRDFSGAKNARKAADGVLTMRHPVGVVSQTFRDIQQRNFKQGANK